MNLQNRLRPVPKASFWASCPREAFTARCHEEYQAHMKGSIGEKLIPAMIREFVEQPRRASKWGTSPSKDGSR